MDEGLDPTLGAILPLIGVVFGVLLGGIATFLLKRRDERLEFRAVARVLVQALDDGADYLDHINEVKTWHTLPDDAAAGISRETWAPYELLVARHLKDNQEWKTVAAAFRVGNNAGWLIARGDTPAGVERVTLSVIKKLRAGAAVLRPHALR